MKKNSLDITPEQRLDLVIRQRLIKQELDKEKKKREEEAKSRLEHLLQPHRDAYNRFDEENDRLAYNFLIRFQKKIFDYKDVAHYEIDWGRGRGMEKVLLPKLTKAGQPIFEALKHTYGFRSFVTWVRYLDGFGKECLAQSTCESLGWVLRYGEDRKGEAERRNQLAKDRLSAEKKKESDSPEWYNINTLRRLAVSSSRQFARTSHRELKKHKKLGASVTAKKEESAKLRKLRESQQRQRNLVKRDIVILEYEMAKNKKK